MRNLLSSTAFIVLNKELARQIGLNEAVLLADLISKEEYFISKGMTDGWFFNTEPNIQRDTTLTPFQQRRCLKTLKKYDIIKVKRKGIPAKQYFKINEQQVIKFLNNLSSTNLTSINNIKEIKLTNKYFKKPSVEEVGNYCYERNKMGKNNVDPEAFWDFYESKDWFVGKSKMKDWKAAVRNWERGDKKKPKSMGKLHSQINAWEEAKKLL
tara:strand:- start:294 stop:926 length:633 start_codon:yes stop_codon:yes gene_type:complete